jgi:hypothetical protein
MTIVSTTKAKNSEIGGLSLWRITTKILKISIESTIRLANGSFDKLPRRENPVETHWSLDQKGNPANWKVSEEGLIAFSFTGKSLKELQNCSLQL